MTPIKEIKMTENHVLPALEDIMTPEQMEEATNDIAAKVNELYQPLLDSIAEKVGFDGYAGTAAVASKVVLSLVNEDGAPVLKNDVTLDVVFTPTVTRNVMEEVVRSMVKEVFARAINDK